MKEKEEKLRMSINLENHRLNNEKMKFRKEYIKGLTYIRHKFSNEDSFTKEILNEFYRVNLNKDIHRIEFIWDDEKEKNNIKYICKRKIRKLKFTYFLYSFILDALLINAIDDIDKGRTISKFIKEFTAKRHHNDIDIFIENLYSKQKILKKFEIPQEMIKIWNDNLEFIKKEDIKVLVTANMSAGKSTLINSIMGYKIANTKNESCTAEVNNYFNKSFNDNKILLYKAKNNLEVIGCDNLVDIESKCKKIYTYMNFGDKNNNFKLTIIDTPGVNSSVNTEHQQITENIIKYGDYNKIVYVINATNIGSDDDYIHLTSVFNNLNNREIIFVLNKLDMFRTKDDSIKESLQQLKGQLKDIGYKSPKICPISAYAGGLFKKVLINKLENEDEEDECEMQLRKFKRDAFDLSKYYENQCEVNIGNKNIDFRGYKYEDIISCLKRTGIINLQNEIMKGNE